MASGRVLLAVIVSLIAGAIASSPTANAAQCSMNPTTGLRTLDSAAFTSLLAGTPAAFAGIPFNAKTSNAQAIEAFAKGKCQKWGVNAGESGYLGTQSVAWTEWDLRSFSSSQSVSVILQLTKPQSTDQFSQRLTIVSVLPSVADNAKCNAAAAATFANWNCEAFITDSCQGYEVTNQKAWTFVGGNRYIFIFDSPATAASQTFHLDMVPRGAAITPQGWESGVSAVTGPAGTTAGSLPANWDRSSRSWDIFPTFEGRISIPGWSANQWPEWNGPSAASDLVGELGVNIVMNIPNWIPGQGQASGITCQSVGQEANCNHSDDSLYSPAFATAGTAGDVFQLEVETFWYNGASEERAAPSGVATIWVSATGGASAQDWTLMATLPSLFTDNWGLERMSIPVSFSDLGNVYFKFNLASADNKLGWAMNTIAVVPEMKFDLCADTVGCTADLCSNEFDSEDDGFGGKTYTPKYFGCRNPSDELTCENKGSPDATCKTWVCNSDESLDENTTPAVDSDGCEAIEDASVCNDGWGCTTDTCDGEGVCHNDPNEAYNCGDGKGCTRDECINKQHEHAADADEEGCWHEADCNDQVDCTTDSCEAAALGGDKCLHIVDFNLCEDFIDCTYELVCDPEQPGMDPVSGCIRIPMDEWCDDNKPCTIDTCEPLTEAEEGMEANDRCFHREMDCDDCIACTVDSCEEGECVNEAEASLCDDGIDCTEDVCNKELGKCQNIPHDSYCSIDRAGLTGCEVFECRPYQSDEANEGNLETNSDSYGCVQTQKVCDDDLACTTDSCEEGACVHEANEAACEDNLECTVDVCDKALGKCTNTPDSSLCHDEAGLCTIKFCGRDGMCHFPEIDCSDDIYCTDDSCDAEEGCEHEANDDKCEDAFLCTKDSCNTNLGGCTNLPDHSYCADNHDLCHTWVCNVASADEGSDGCVALIPKDCDDGIPCTADSCNMTSGECINTPQDSECYDGLTCTDDVCDAVIGCTNTANNTKCDDDNKCTIDICGCDGVCYNEEIVCDDNIPCTDDFCDEATGECDIEIAEGACDDDIACTKDTCDLTLGGCTNIEINADCPSSADGCYVSECSIENKGCVGVAHHDACDDHIPCTYDVCTPTGCVHTEMNSLCNDGLDCTLDYCSTSALGCVFEPVNERCDDFSNCTLHYCSPLAGCVIVPDNSVCNDDIDCTEDVCDSPAGVASGCSNIPKNSWCDDGVGCTDDICSAATGCSNPPVDERCDDGWDCTEDDTCHPTQGCVYDDSECPWASTQELCLECTTSSAQILQLNYTDGTGAMQFATRDAETDELKTNIVALPTDQVIIGGASQKEVRVGADDGLVINDNIRLVPLDDEDDTPVCNEIRRGSIIVVPVKVACGENWCHQDTLKVCSKQQDYEWVSL